MKRIIVMSDNHGDMEDVKNILSKESFDIAIHLGDSMVPQTTLDLYFDHYIIGNNDYDLSIDEEKIIEVEGIKILLMHGHQIFTFDRTNQTKFANYAKKKNVDILMFGHYHFPIHENIDGKIILNPGSISWPRNGSKKSYITMEINNKKIKNIKFNVIK